MKRKQITLFVTPAEKDTITALASGGNVSAYIRQLIRADAEARGIKWPTEQLNDTRGKYERGD